jgi:nitroreductase
MCLMLACVEEGLQCCPLNLAVTNHREGQISRVGDIPSDQRLIVMIAFGECDLSPMKAAASPRLAVDDVLTLHSLASPNPPSAASP